MSDMLPLLCPIPDLEQGTVKCLHLNMYSPDEQRLWKQPGNQSVIAAKKGADQRGEKDHSGKYIFSVGTF